MLVPIYKMGKIIKKIAQNKGEIVRVEMDMPVSPSSMELWQGRDYKSRIKELLL